jgi:L-lactate dehydrogenase
LSKIAIIGAGFVGSTTAYACMLGGTAREIVLIDKIKEKARGEVMDLNHGASFVRPLHIYAGDFTDCRGADIIVITAGTPQIPGQSRLDLVHTNSRIMEQIVDSIRPYNREGILLVATNPVDIMAHVAWQSSGLPSARVIGSGTVLDTSRFRHLLSERCGIDPRNVHAYVIGEHGDSEIPLWSKANIGGVPLEEFCRQCPSICSQENRIEIARMVREAAYEIIDGKGATYYAIALALRRIMESILRDESSVLTVSTYIENFYGMSDLYLSLPCVLGRSGIKKVIPFTLVDEEKEQFIRSAEKIKSLIPTETIGAVFRSQESGVRIKEKNSSDTLA